MRYFHFHFLFLFLWLLLLSLLLSAICFVATVAFTFTDCFWSKINEKVLILLSIQEKNQWVPSHTIACSNGLETWFERSSVYYCQNYFGPVFDMCWTTIETEREFEKSTLVALGCVLSVPRVNWSFVHGLNRCYFVWNTNFWCLMDVNSKITFLAFHTYISSLQSFREQAETFRQQNKRDWAFSQKRHTAFRQNIAAIKKQ